jgi:uncharacterized membrane protein YidH (DUF202 family)
MRWWAKAISAVFNPAVEIPAITILLLALAPIGKNQFDFILLLIGINVVIPGSYFVMSWFKRKRRDFDMHRREMRLPLFRLVIVSHGMGIVLAYVVGQPYLAKLLLSLWLVNVIFSLITLYWKVSWHTCVNAMLVYLFVVLVQPWQWLWLVVVAVGWARVVNKDHTPAQVTVGALIPPLVLSMVYRLWGVV